jgi:hypothetical protein
VVGHVGVRALVRALAPSSGLLEGNPALDGDGRCEGNACKADASGLQAVR